MAPYRYNVRIFLLVSCTLAILIYNLVNSLPFASSYAMLVTPTAIAGGVGTFWWLFDRYLWRYPISRLIGLTDLPDLNGSWVGTINRRGEVNPHTMEYIISQTFTSISIHARTDHAASDSITAQFLTNEARSTYKILNYWECRTKRRIDDAMENFRGISEIVIWYEGNELQLRDYYFTNRNPATEGNVVMRRAGG